MKKAFVLARRELAGYFFSPIAYIILALFVLASGLWFFHKIFVPGHEASLRVLFDAMAYMMVFAVPLLTMRLLSEEFHSGTIETLMTAPVKEFEVVFGKFLGVMCFYLILLVCTTVYLFLMALFGQPDTGVAASGYLGMVLLGAAFSAVGVFASTLTRYQLVAALVGVAILASFTLVMGVLTAYGPEPLNYLAARLNAMTYFKDFSRGVLDTRGVVYFLTATALMLFLGTKTLESQRWR